jgi:transcriptional regulator with XRE-family HTH domain
VSKTARRDEKCLRETIAENVKAQRRALGLSGVLAAEHCGLHVRHLQKIEAAALNLTLATLARLSAGLDIEAAYLLSERPPAKGRARARGGRRAASKSR